MTVPFGFSIGDFVAGVGLVRDVIEALQASSSSTARYQGLISELFTLERGLLEVKKLGLGDKQATQPERLDIEALHGALRLTAVQCQNSITRLLGKVKKYEGHLSANGSGSKWKDALRKVQWTLLTDKDLEDSRAEIRSYSTSITMLLTLTQLKTMKLQSQECRSKQMRIVRWLQQGCIETMSNLTGALTGIGRNLQELLETAGVLVRLDHQILQKVLQIQHYISPSPRYTEYGEPIFFVDAFGKETRFYLDFVYSAANLEDWLKRRFGEAGYEKILNREYALEDMKTRRQINFSRDWQTQLYPGMCLGMDMIYKRHQDQLNTCPGCQREYLGTTDENVECPNCGVHFRRIDELLEFEGNADNFTNIREAAATLPDLSESHQQELQLELMGDSSPCERQLKLCIKRMHREQKQMQLFRRFRFQPTRAESELAMLPPYNCILKRILLGGVDSKPGFEYEGAEELYCQMLKTFERNHNPTKPKRVCGLLNLGVVLAIYKQHSAAEKIFLRILEEIGGSLRPEDGLTIAQTLNNLAVVKSIQGNDQEAEMLLHRALQGREQALDTSAGDLLPYMLDWCNNLAMILRNQNKAKEARHLQELVIKKVCEFWDMGNPVFSSYRKNLEWIQH